MEIRIFQSAQGDCLLVESKDGKRILCDGGMPRSMKQYVRGELSRLNRIDFVYVSHTDEDHIGGVLQLLWDALEWRVWDHHQARNSRGVRRPKVPRPPKIGGIWHNAFRDQIKENRGAIEDLLAASAPVLRASGIQSLAEQGVACEKISSSIRQALKTSRLISPELLNIPLNKIPGRGRDGKLMMWRRGQRPFRVGSLTFTIIGPTEEELSQLRQGWNNWLKDHGDVSKEIDREIRKKIGRADVGAMTGAGIDLHRWNKMPSHEGVSVPNIASLMFMVEEDGKRLLLTGDSQEDFILGGLKKAGFLDRGCTHVDVFKMPHHGSDYNVDGELLRKVSADHYVFCGNGRHTNPELSVVDLVERSRLGPQSALALHPRASNRRFYLWFSTQAKSDDKRESAKHMRKLEAHARSLAKRSRGKMRVRFNGGASVSLSV